jgi:hypothetical protein
VGIIRTHSLCTAGFAVAALLLLIAAFAASPAQALPEGRAYEMVSKPDKEGKDLNVENYEISADGEAIAYSSYPSFGDPEGGGFQNQYVATRQSPFWSFQALSPKQMPNPGQYTARVLGFSDDLRRFVIRTNAALTPEAVDRVENLYLRDRISGETTLVSPGAESTTEFVEFNASSEDLSTLFFEKAEPLLEGDPDTRNIYEWSDGELRLASLKPDGTPFTSPAGAQVGDNGTFEDEAVSDDGSRMYFVAEGRVYLREDAQPSVLVSQTEAAAPAAGTFLSATPDGRYAFFTSTVALRSTDTNAQADLYRYDAEDGSIEHLSVDAEPADGVSPNVAGGYFGASDDGSRIYFIATGQIVAGAPTAPQRKFYLWEEGVGPRFVTGLSAGDPFQNSTPVGKVSSDARYLTFSSSLSLTGYPNANVNQIYVYDAETEEIACASCDPDGSAAVGQALWKSQEAFFKYLKENVDVVSDGGEVLFQTPQALSDQDHNGVLDVYLWTGERAELVSSGRSGSPSDAVGITPDGRDVLFITREKLVGWDVDDAVDLYDARRGGGFPEPPDPELPCDASTCKPPQQADPSFTLPGSRGFRGSGDVVEEPRKRFRLLPLSAADGRRLARSGRLAITVEVPRAGKVSAVASVGGRKLAAAGKRAKAPGRTKLVLRVPDGRRQLLAAAARIRVEVRQASRIDTTTVKAGR